MHAAQVRRCCAVAAALTGLFLAGAPSATADNNGPSAHDVAAGNAAVRHREAQVAAAASAVSRTQARLQRLATAAEVAIEAYDGARVKEAQARAQAAMAQVVLDAAATRVDAARTKVDAFAKAAYMAGGMSGVTAVLDADGPQSLLDRMGTLDAISHGQSDAMQALDAARVYQLAVQQEAQAALDRAAAASAAAARAKQQAQASVVAQTGLLRQLRSRQRQLSTLLDQARAHASALERARLAAIAQARAEAQARAAAAAAAAAQQHSTPPPTPSGGGSSGDISGTVSASTEQRAVQYAESQIGKPYQWGAAGPDSYDCSGLVMWAYDQVGVHLDHYTGYQWNEGAHIPVSALRPGDLVFFATNTSDPNTIHHVGIYIGNGNMVEAPYTGADVRISPAFRPDLIGAVRPYNR